jgi:hypothetical protein
LIVIDLLWLDVFAHKRALFLIRKGGEEVALVNCPECWYEGQPISARGMVYDPDNPNANAEGLVACSNCNGEGMVEDNQLSLNLDE